MITTDESHALLHREEVPGRYCIEMYRRDAPTGVICTWRHDYIVEVREGGEGSPSYQFVSCKNAEAEERFTLEGARLARKWGR